jgi:hypothetical protein
VKALLSVLALAALVAVLPASSRPTKLATSTPTTPPVSALLPHGAFGPRQLVFFAYVRSVTRTAGRYRMRVDPAWVLSGLTGTTAAVEDGALRPGEPIPNDYYNVNEGRRLLTYRIAPTARVTVLANPGTGPTSTVVPLAEFSQIVKGKNPAKRRGLWGPASGFWIRAQGDTALTIDQAYRP